MPSNDEIAERLAYFGSRIDSWKNEAARLTLFAAKSRQEPASKAELVHLEETAGAIYSELLAFRDTVADVANRSPAAAAELSPVSDAMRLVLLEITELGVRLYSDHSGQPHSQVP